MSFVSEIMLNTHNVSPTLTENDEKVVEFTGSNGLAARGLEWSN